MCVHNFVVVQEEKTHKKLVVEDVNSEDSVEIRRKHNERGANKIVSDREKLCSILFHSFLFLLCCIFFTFVHCVPSTGVLCSVYISCKHFLLFLVVVGIELRIILTVQHKFSGKYSSQKKKITHFTSCNEGVRSFSMKNGIFSSNAGKINPLGKISKEILCDLIDWLGLAGVSFHSTSCHFTNRSIGQN